MTRIPILLLFLLLASPLSAAAGNDYLLQGTTCLAEKAYDRAVRAFKLAIRVDPKSADAYKGLGCAYYNLGNGETASFPQLLDEAIAAYQQAVSISTDADTLYNLGMSYLMAGKVSEARITMERLYPVDRNQAYLLAFKIGAEHDSSSGHTSYVTILKTKETNEERRTTVKVENRQVWVPVTFEHKGRTVSTWLLMDTGATSTLIPAALARQLGVVPGETTVGRGVLADGSVVRTDNVVLDQVRVGPKEKRNLKVNIISSAEVGLLGLDFLGEFLYIVDTKKGVIHWQ
jgi:tetratricopeptide (TPR) repeat protein